MQAPLYAIDGDVTPENYYAPCVERNKQNLLPEHREQINTAFLEQLPLAGLLGGQMRIAIAVFNQTIGYDKFEDDMNGSRLNQLTGIRRDHANAIVRDLERLNVLVTHRGHYGKWMSINFNFEQWGQLDAQVETNNNPSCLLSEDYQPLINNELKGFELHKPPKSVNKNHTVTTPVTTPVSAPVIAPVEPKMPITPTKPISPTTPVSSANSTNPSLIIPAIPQQQTSVSPTKEASEILTINKAVELNYPQSIPQQLRELLAKHLEGFKIPEQAQRLLNYFAKCLKERHIRNPIAYFISLKKRLFDGKLDLSETEYQSDVDATKKAQAEKTQAGIAYSNAVADLQLLKKVIENVSSSKKCTFEEALQEMNYVNIWKKANECLATTKEALKKAQFQAGEVL